MFTDYAARWVVLGVCGLVAAIWLRVLHISLDFGSVLPKLAFAGVLLFFAALYTIIGNRLPRFSRLLALATDWHLSLVQATAIMLVLLPITYLAATPGFPLLDDRLSRLDAMVGFDWDTAAKWVAERPAVDWLLDQAYFSFGYQGVAILGIGSFKRDRNSEIIWLLIVSLLITSAIFAFTPAVGKIGHTGTGFLDLLMKIRSGNWSVMVYAGEGVITFPSFHTALAIILTYAVRHYRWALAVFAPLNILVILSTPAIGGHYLVDVFGGAAVAGLSIFLVRSLRRPMSNVAAWKAKPAAPSPLL